MAMDELTKWPHIGIKKKSREHKSCGSPPSKGRGRTSPPQSPLTGFNPGERK